MSDFFKSSSDLFPDGMSEDQIRFIQSEEYDAMCIPLTLEGECNLRTSDKSSFVSKVRGFSNE